MANAEVQIRTFLCRSDNIGVLIRDPASGACASIDVPEAEPVLAALDAEGWTLTDILVTHRHGDHIEGIPEVVARTGARVTAPEKARSAVPGAARYVREGDTVTVGGLTAAVWETPGHCADHVTYYFAQAGVVFAGDTLFTLGCGRVMEAEPATLWRSLARFLDLPDATEVYSGHDYVLSNGRFAQAADPDNADLKERVAEAERLAQGGGFLIPSTIGAEKATNPFLRAGEPVLARSAGLEPGTDPAQVFTALRTWKNTF